MSHAAKLPLVCSCSGASSAARMANHIDPEEAARVLPHRFNDPEFLGGGNVSNDEPHECASAPCYLSEFQD